MPRSSALGLCCALALLAGAPSRAAGEPQPAAAAPAAAPAPAVAPVEADREAAKKSTAEDFRTLREERGPDEESPILRVFWMFAAMAFVIGAIYITLNFGLRKLMGARAVGAASLVQVMERIPLDQKKSLYVLRAAGEYLLVGGADGGLGLICKLDSQEVERLERESRVQAQGLSPFLQKLLSRRGGSPPPSA